MTTIAPQQQYAPLISRLNDLSIDLAKSDGQLEDAELRGNRVGSGWDDWMDSTSRDLLQVRDEFSVVRPDRRDIIDALGFEVRDIAASGGQLGANYRNNQTFGSGWGQLLDSTLETVRSATNALLSAPGPIPGQPFPPAPQPSPQPPYPTPPTPQPTHPTPPAPPVGGGNVPNLIPDVQRAAGLVQKSLDLILKVPAERGADESTKPLRKEAYDMNRAAQAVLEPLFEKTSGFTHQNLRAADASLEDVTWQLIGKPSPDGRFNGVDINGAIDNTRQAVALLAQVTGNAPVQSQPRPNTSVPAPTVPTTPIFPGGDNAPSGDSRAHGMSDGNGKPTLPPLVQA